MNCQGYRTLVRDALQGTISRSQRAEAELHLAECTDCGAFHKQTYGVSCRDLTEALDDYVDGALEPARHVIFERHVSICIECRDYAAAYRTTIKLGRSAYRGTDGAGSAAVPESFVRAILRARRRGE